MKVDSLKELESAFAKWRRGKTYAREPMPEELVLRARRAADKHGLTAIVRVTGVDGRRLFRKAIAGGAGAETKKKRRRETAVPREVPTFSRLSLSGPSGSGVRPLAEIETSTGVKLRVFEPTPEMLHLLSAACGVGEER